MWKWFCIFAVIASAMIAVAVEQHYAREKYQAQSQTDCVALSVSSEEKHTCAKDAQNRKDYAPWWNVLVAWPEGITTWAIISTGLVIAWQSNETRKAANATADAASAALRSVKLQEIQFGQWVEIKNWRNITTSAYPNVARPTICVRAKIRNATQYPLVLKEFKIRQGGRTETSAPNWTIPPKGAYKVPIYADIVAEDGLSEYARGNYGFGVAIDLIFQDAFKKDRSQHFMYWVYCGRDYCRAEMTESHQYQEVIRQISSEPSPRN